MPQEYLDATLSPPASVFIPLATPCALFQSDRIEPNQRYTFGLGTDEKTISASDISGVALAAIQGLNAKLAEKSDSKCEAEFRSANGKYEDEVRSAK